MCLLFCFYSDSDVCPSCKKVLEGLESIDDETDALDITFVKINDPRYAKKYGVNKIPALVYFRKKFPSIYRGTKCIYAMPYRDINKFVLEKMNLMSFNFYF